MRAFSRKDQSTVLAVLTFVLVGGLLAAGCPKKEAPAGPTPSVRRGEPAKEQTIKVAISSRPGQWNLDERVKGYKDYFAENAPNIEVVQVIDDKTEKAEGEKQATAVLSRYPDLAGFAGVNAVSGLGIAAALKSLGKVGKVKVVAMDGDSGILDLIEEGVIDASIAQRQYWMSYIGIAYLYGLNHGVFCRPDETKEGAEPIPAVIDTTVVEVNRKNLDQFRTPSQGAKETLRQDFKDVMAKAKAARTPDASNEEYVFIGISTGAEYWLAAKAGLQDGAAELGVKSQFTGPTTQDATTQAEMMAQITAKRPAGILIAPGRPDTLTPYINQAIDAGIPVICLDTDAPPTAGCRRIAYFGTDNYNAGRKGAEILAGLVTGQAATADPES